jgi:hypothetical protein
MRRKAMARFYLHLRRGREIAADRDGVEFPNQQTAKQEAMRALAKAWHKMPSGLDPARYSLEIADEGGQAVLTIALAEALRTASRHPPRYRRSRNSASLEATDQ